MMPRVIAGDCREVMAGMGAASVDAIVCDPPYGMSFMGKAWDHGVPGVPFWTAAFRVAKPGAHLLAFGGTRTHHRLACAIEDAGWEIRDCLMWLYGSGFPKSLNIGKAIDKAAGAEREVIGRNPHARPIDGHGGGYSGPTSHDPNITAPATDDAKRWHGWGTALKPAWEPVIMARKPLDGTVANNTLAHGCAGLNIDGCRVETKDNLNGGTFGGCFGNGKPTIDKPNGMGRWPANLIHDGSEEATAGMGSASRYFYCAKASKKDRGDGNTHPTVKPLALMQYLCRLVTPPGGTVLDPFAGSGSTLLAAQAEGFAAIGIEIDDAYLDICKARLRGNGDGTENMASV